MGSARDQQLNSKWLKATLTGSLWASVEIIFGSFLHNLKIPFSGTILTVISVFLLVSFFQVWKENGIIWRAGLICALMKSVSPSAVILGPMIGIMTEAILLEMTIRVLGKNLVAYFSGGALAVLSALFHKVIMLVILYGMNLVKLAEEFYYFILRQVNLQGVDPWFLIGAIVILHLLAGVVSSYSGYISGKKLLMKTKDTALPDIMAVGQMSDELFTPGSNRNYSLIHLFLIVSGTVLCFAILNFLPFYFGLGFTSLFLVYCLVRYTTVLNKFRKPSIWVQFAIIILGSSVLMKGVAGGLGFASQGLTIGLKMILRAVLIIVGFSCLSIELRNPVVGNFLKRKGFNNLYNSLTISFSILPLLLSEGGTLERGSLQKKKSIEGMMWKAIMLQRYLGKEAINLNIKKGFTQNP